ncbi:hypothetical protein [Aeoliella sp. SH292]|uniref:hypothetical protein n=1 Tax=Aeoliella sp. SH292 TaxID=3454464 RepID=UPI003F9846B2
MATTIVADGDSIKIDKAFVSGKDRVSVNGKLAFEGKLNQGRAETFNAGTRTYAIESKVISKLTSAVAYYVQIHENGQQVHAGIYDHMGKPLANEGEVKTAGALQASAMVGMGVGVAIMMFLNAATGVVPGGAIGGAIGGGVGGAIGMGIGKLIFGKK